ncbi:MAG: hypothetical protein QOI04_269 [Verrucomicrobiota bacterium]|jgi:hypothetical protein
MKKFTSLLIGLTLALAGAAIAQQPDEQPTPTGKKHAAEKTQTTEAKPGANAATETAPTTGKQGGARHERAASKATQNAETTPKAAGATSTETNVSGQAGTSVTPETGKGRHGKNARGANVTTEASASPSTATATESATTGATEQTGKGRHGKNARGANATTAASATPATATSSATPAASASVSAATATSASVAPTAAASASAAPSVAAAAGQQNVTATGGAAVKADPQKVQQVKQQVQQIKQQHVNFRAQARPDRVPAVTFSASYRIQGSDRWQGPQYEVYRSYHPERHDRGWYSSRYNRVELIGGGYYYWNNNYWYPAWGYDSANEYYAYDAPIYVGHRAEPPDRVIADVQAELQQMGYYRGEVDGLLGPLTREALTAYQADQGLAATAVIDQPTLESLNMG